VFPKNGSSSLSWYNLWGNQLGGSRQENLHWYHGGYKKIRSSWYACTGFPWFEPRSARWFKLKVRPVSMVRSDPGRSCLPPLSYKLSMEYCWPKSQVTSIFPLWNLSRYEVRYNFLPSKSNEPFFPRCAPPLSAHHPVRSEWVRTGFDSMVRAKCSFGPVRTVENQWLMASLNQWLVFRMVRDLSHGVGTQNGPWFVAWSRYSMVGSHFSTIAAQNWWGRKRTVMRKPGVELGSPGVQNRSIRPH